MVEHFRELRVYRQGFGTARRLFRLSKAWPKEERYSLTDQIRRSSRSVCANVSEAWRKRRYPKHFISKISDADAEAAETQSWLDFALDCEYIEQEDYESLNAEYDQIIGGLVKMMANPDSWCGPSNLVREEEAAYLTDQASSHTPTPPSAPPTVILIIDNYDSFTYNLVHLVGRHTDAIEVVRNDAVTVEEARAMQPRGLLISPGPGRPAEAGITEALIRELGPTVPTLGVCLGHQAIGEVFGGRIAHARALMHGKTSRVHHDGRSVFEGVEQDFTATRYHSLVVDREGFPDALDITAETDDGTIMGLRHRTLPIEGIQFHPESILTDAGPKLIENWLEKIVPSERRMASSG